MQMHFEVPTTLDYFASLVDSDGDFALFEAAVSLAQDEYPDLDVQGVLHEMDQLQARLRRRVGANAGQLHKLRTLNQFFFLELGFGVNANDYYDPDNSFIHKVLHSRRGIPITLALVWMEMAQELGLDVRGICFPGHFLVKIDLVLGQAVIDPANGQSLSRENLTERLEPLRRQAASLDVEIAPLGWYLQAASEREIMARMLRNLKELHRENKDWWRLLAVQERLVVLLPQSWPEYRDRGLAHAELGHTEQAVADLECYLVHTDDLVDVDAIADRVDALRGG